MSKRHHTWTTATALTLLCLVGCTREASVEDVSAACERYLLDYETAPSLDSAGQAVVEALDDPEISQLAEDLNEELTALESSYPDVFDVDDSAERLRIAGERYGPEAQESLVNFGRNFIELDAAVRRQCSVLDKEASSGASTPSSPAFGGSLEPTSTLPFRVTLERPIAIYFCYEMDRPVCESENYVESTVQLGYRLPPPDGIPLPTNRDAWFWQSLSLPERDTYLAVALWNQLAHLGVNAGNQTLTQAQVKVLYDRAKELTVNLGAQLSKGVDAVAAIEAVRESWASSGGTTDELVLDRLTNAVIFVALPAIAPEFISVVDSVVVYRD